MIKKITRAIRNGIKKLKWFFSLISERIKIEIAVIRLLGENEKFAKEIESNMISIGTRVFALKDDKEINVFEDKQVKEALGKLIKLEEKKLRVIKEAEEISALEV